MFVKGVALFLEVTVNAKFVWVVLCEADNKIAEHDTETHDSTSNLLAVATSEGSSTEADKDRTPANHLATFWVEIRRKVTWYFMLSKVYKWLNHIVTIWCLYPSICLVAPY